MATITKRSLEPNLLSTRKFEPRIRWANFPVVCMNQSGVVVVFYQHLRKIYFIVGSVSVDLTTEQNFGRGTLAKHSCEWGNVQLYGDGLNVRAALNESNQIVVVRSGTYRRRCMYRSGVVIQNERNIIWKEDDTFFTKGVNPAVALKGSTVIFVHELNFGLYRCFYNIAKISDGSIRFVGTRNQPLPALDERKEISLSLNASGYVVFSCRWYAGGNLWYAVGKLSDGEDSINDVVRVQQYAQGLYSHICLLDDGNVVEVHEKWMSSLCMFKFGRLDGNTIAWGEDLEFDYGNNPCTAVTNNCQMIVVRVTRPYVAPGELHYKFGFLSESVGHA